MSKRRFLAVCTTLFMLFALHSHAFRCTVCHSKNPAMKKMHAELQGRDCFACHKIGQKLMGKGEPKDIASLLKKRSSDPACIECHGEKTDPPQTH